MKISPPDSGVTESQLLISTIRLFVSDIAEDKFMVRKIKLTL